MWINTLTESDNIILGKRKTEKAMPYIINKIQKTKRPTLLIQQKPENEMSYIVDPTENRERNFLNC